MMKRVVIVDDSRAMRAWLRAVLDRDPRLNVVGEAENANQARQIIKETKPDVITLDIHMPGMSGLEFLSRLMRLHPLPVVMVSAATKFGSEATITALMNGAVDCILKPTGGTDAKTSRDMARRVFSAACSSVRPSGKVQSFAVPTLQPPDGGPQPIILIGASTGGVSALEVVLRDLSPDGPPVVIVQHMPATFLISFSKLLNRKLDQDVGLATDGGCLGAGQIVLAPEQGYHTEINRRNGKWVTYLRPNNERAAHCPSVDALLSSATPFGHDVIGVILTGLGRDGAEGLLQLHRSGAQTIGQNEATSVVFGMPRAAWEFGAVDHQLPLEHIGQAINAAVEKHGRRPHRLVR
ncbi:chemotaxis-specific protein-glutamate methyltransferase CheB [Sulfitobacter sp. MF3-043]|uniref:chemotaxis-specific protein-glutamate methyltransferase CheB n=1 Tax=Sulfitobacter sediminivivens TaxID=3252902 RepID=UPI0036DE1084